MTIPGAGMAFSEQSHGCLPGWRSQFHAAAITLEAISVTLHFKITLQLHQHVQCALALDGSSRAGPPAAWDAPSAHISLHLQQRQH